jgi:hypothetical protein
MQGAYVDAYAEKERKLIPPFQHEARIYPADSDAAGQTLYKHPTQHLETMPEIKRP